jgi:hypothetical protein
MQVSYKHAGVIPSGFHNGEKKYIFAVQNNNNVSSFHGEKDSKDHDNPMRTAAREASEESLNIFGNAHAIYQSLHNATIINNTKTNGIVYITNSLPIPSHPKHTFYAKREHLKQAGLLKFPFNEIKEIIVVGRNELIKEIDNNTHGIQGRWVREHVWSTLKLARAQGKL